MKDKLGASRRVSFEIIEVVRSEVALVGGVERVILGGISQEMCDGDSCLDLRRNPNRWIHWNLRLAPIPRAD